MTIFPPHYQISPTAKLVAYWRQFTDIPYAGDVAKLFSVEHAYHDLMPESDSRMLGSELMAPLLEARYKSIQVAIKKYEIKQVLEFASGISLRGLAMTKDPQLIYVETDLPGLTEEKLKLINVIMDRHEIKARPNLFFYPVNIINYSEIEAALGRFDQKKPLAIVHEGLFQYLTREEKTIAAQNIHRILQRFGGVWMTPDLDTMASLHTRLFETKQFEHFVKTIRETTGRDFEKNAFTDDADMHNFFAALGFMIERRPQLNNDVILSSIKDKQLPKDLYDALNSLSLWILTAQ